jgi:hypothetical protein
MKKEPLTTKVKMLENQNAKLLRENGELRLWNRIYMDHADALQQQLNRMAFEAGPPPGLKRVASRSKP